MYRFIFILSLVVITGRSGFAQLDPKDLPAPYKTWFLEEVNYIMSPLEKDAFLNLVSTTERESFIDAFWRKRDENPTTEENETRIEHYERLAYVNQFFGRGTFRQGWQTDMGRYYILLGPPRTKQNWEARDEVYPAELWFYNDAQLRRLNLPPFFYLLFFKRHAIGEFQLYNPIADGPQSLLQRPSTEMMDFRNDTRIAWEELRQVDPELAHASLSFRTDEGDIAQFQNPSFGSIALIDNIIKAPLVGVDTSYAERLDFERGSVESDYMFSFVPSVGMINILPGPANAAYLHWAIQLDARNVAFVEDKDRGKYASSFITSMEIVAKDDPNKILLQFRRESFIELDYKEEAMLRRPITYTGMTPVVPGEYDVRIILRNRACPGRQEQKCVRSYTLLDGGVTIPDWLNDGVLLGDLVIGYQQELKSGEPVYQAYRFGNQEIHPNPEGVYAVDDSIVVMIESKAAPKRSQMRFQIQTSELEIDQKIVLDETAPVLDSGLIVREFFLRNILPARYDLHAILTDENGQELERKTTSFVVSPRTSIVRAGVRGAAPQINAEQPGAVEMLLGEQYAAIESHQKARELLETAISKNSMLGPARESLANYEMRDGNTARVVELLAPVYSSVQDRYEVLELLGRAYFREGSYAASIEILEKAIILRRPLPPMLNMLANAQYREGNLERSVELLKQSFELDNGQEDLPPLIEKIIAERATTSKTQGKQNQ